MAKTNKGRKLFATTATAALVASAIVPVASAAQVNDYNSIASYAQEAVQDLVDRGVVQGDANGNFQPRKSVSRAEAATVLSKALGLTTTDAIYFTDVKSGAWYYDAINAAVNNRVFSGKGDGIFDPNGNLTRGEAAVILVSAFNLTGKAPLAQFADEKSVKEWAKESLEIAVGNGVVKGDNGRIKANDAITKQDFAVMFARAEEASETVATHTVKAINATTVEVTFAEEVKDVKALKFTIDGLEVKNAAVKQTDSKTVVLTTAAQEKGKEYTVKVDGEEIGKFTGIEAIVPTSIKLLTTNTQSKVGNEITLKADIGVKAAGVPVTFNVDAPTGSLNKDQVVEVYTDADGIATFSYTQYSADVDDVAVYPTGAATVRSFAKVYWGVDNILTIEEDKAGNVVANGTKKVYTVTYKDPKTGQPVPNANLNVTFLENINVAFSAISKATVTDPLTNLTVVPYQALNGTQQDIQVRTDSKGQATFVVSGTNVTATPVVFVDGQTAGTFSQNDGDNRRLDATELAAVANKTVFEGAQLNHAITVTRDGEEEAAAGINNARKYTIEVKDKDGKVYANGTVNVALDENIDNIITTTTAARFTDGKTTPADLGIQTTVKLDKDGKGSFYLYGADDVSGTPVVWIDQNVAENHQGVASQQGVLESGEPFAKGLVSNFQHPRVIGAQITLEGKKEDGTADSTADFAFALTNQSGKALPNLDGKLTYQIRNTGGNSITVTTPNATFTKADGTALTSGNNVIAGYGSITITADLDGASSLADLDIVSTDGESAISVEVTPTFRTDNNPTGLGLVSDARNNNLTVYAGTRKATIGSVDGIPAFVANAPVEWANVSKDTMKLVGSTGTIDYSKATFFIQNGILGVSPSPEYTSVPLSVFKTYISENDVVTFTKGEDGKHVIRLEANNVGRTDGTTTPVVNHTGEIKFTNSTFNAVAAQNIELTDLDFENNDRTAETVSVAVKDTTGRSVAVTLTETADTGVFAGTISAANLANFADGLLTVTYNDARNASGVAQQIPATATLNTLAVGLESAATQQTNASAVLNSTDLAGKINIAYTGTAFAGAYGNELEVEVVDSGTGTFGATFNAGKITIELAGTTPTTGAVLAAIDALQDFTATLATGYSAAGVFSAAEAPVAFTGGQDVVTLTFNSPVSGLVAGNVGNNTGDFRFAGAANAFTTWTGTAAYATAGATEDTSVVVTVNTADKQIKAGTVNVKSTSTLEDTSGNAVSTGLKTVQ